jgi:formate hydrogenlyase subunit 3/multisubunit Na+/H+ antiporter MnhD subunit
MSTLYLRTSSDGFAQIKGIAYQMPVATAGLLIGGLTLAGSPFTAGFAPYWQLLSSVAATDGRWLALFVLGGLGVAIGYLRGFQAALSLSRSGDLKRGGASDAFLKLQEPPLLLILIGLLAFACIGLGFFPALLIEPLQAVSTRIPLIIQ